MSLARVTLIGIGLLGLAGFVGCDKEKLPSRDEIPILREKVYTLEQSVLNRNRAGIDSLLSVDVLKSGQDADSLLRFVYGPDGAYPFRRFGDYEIFYGNNVAVVSCYIMDSTENHERPFKLQFQRREDAPWLLRSFEAGEPDSTGVTSP